MAGALPSPPHPLPPRTMGISRPSPAARQCTSGRIAHHTPSSLRPPHHARSGAAAERRAGGARPPSAAAHLALSPDPGPTAARRHRARALFGAGGAGFYPCTRRPAAAPKTQPWGGRRVSARPRPKAAAGMGPVTSSVPSRPHAAISVSPGRCAVNTCPLAEGRAGRPPACGGAGRAATTGRMLPGPSDKRGAKGAHSE
jgi:hypothetical protein